METFTADVEDETILSTIFKDTFPESLRDSAEFGHYLAELSSYGVKQLCREPDRLADERSQILEQTQDLAFHNYKTFIQTAECCKEIFQDFQVIEKHVDSLLSKLPELNTTCDQFIKQAHDINLGRRTNSLTLQKHAQLLEILEMPQLMDTCVRNGYYDEALELATHVKRLEKKHAANIPVIANIVSEVQSSTQLMLSQLIHQLRTNVQLPACLRVIGYLRRMDVFTDAELRIKFLQARDAWFQSVLNSIPVDDPYHHITKTVEASRVHLFDIVTQYRAIFTDDDLLLTAPADDRPNDSILFHGWVVQKVSQFLQTLERDLQLGVGGRLDSVLGQCMYFGLSFSRVGADFRGLLSPIFERAALAGFTRAVNEANARFEDMMQSYTLLGTAPLTGSLYGLPTQSTVSLHAPMSLLEFNPLAVYCNTVLTAFNDLRLCLPLSLACDVTGLVQSSLLAAVNCILTFHRVDKGTFTVQEQDHFTRLCQTFATDLVPYFNNCLQTLFPPSQLALLLGVPVSELNKLGKIGQVDVDGIISPLLQIVPTLLDVHYSAEEILPRPVLDDGQQLIETVQQDSSEILLRPTADSGNQLTETVHLDSSKSVAEPVEESHPAETGRLSNTVIDDLTAEESVDELNTSTELTDSLSMS